MKTNKNGFTIVEVLVASVITLLVCASVFLFSYMAQDNIAVMGKVLFISERGRLAVNHISNDIREAVSLVESHGSYNTDDSTIVLKLPSVDSSGDATDPNNDFDIVVYALNPSDQTRLLRIVDAKDGVSSRSDSIDLITKGVDALQFSSYGTALSSIGTKSSVKNIGIRIVTKGTLFGKTHTNEIESSVSLRNKPIGI